MKAAALRSFGDLFVRAFLGWSADSAPSRGAALAFYTLFSLAPFPSGKARTKKLKNSPPASTGTNSVKACALYRDCLFSKFYYSDPQEWRKRVRVEHTVARKDDRRF